MASLFLAPRTTQTASLWSRLDDRGRLTVLCGIAAGIAVIGGSGTTAGRALVGASGLLLFVIIALSNRDNALVLVVIWLILLGFVRRLLIPFVGWAPDDPLLLVGPAAAVTLWLSGRRDSPVGMSSVAAFSGFLLLWAVAHIANPSEPSLVVGVRGLLFFFTPLAWFFVGRTLPGSVHDRVLTIVVGLTGVVALHGLYQGFVGFLPFELTWLHVSNQGASIFLPGFKVRPFSTFVSPQEYGAFLVIAAVVITSRLLHPPPRATATRRRWLLTLLLLTLVALFFQGARGSFMLTFLALSVIAVARLRSFLAFLGVATVVTGLALWVGARDYTPPEEVPTGTAPTSADAVVSHQLSGLTNPSSSSATLHIEQALQGFEQGVANPLGLGVSNATIARARAEGATVTPENDVGNTMVSLGLPGGFALLGLVMAGLAGAIRVYRVEPTATHLAWIGLLVGSVGQWLNGALYAVSTILFLSLGGIDRSLVARMRAGRPRKGRP